MIRLSQLAFGCFVYGGLSNYDESYLRFLKITGGAPDLGNPSHRKALLEWLNKWGCRQFAVKYHDHSSREILSWHNAHASTLFPRDRELPELGEPELAAAGAAYESLSARIASYKKRKGRTYAVSFGPTGAAKILFAIRPHALPPWDDAIRRKLGHDESEASYVSFLKSVKSLLGELARSCERHGLRLQDLPQALGRPDSTVPKLIDEHYWVTKTKNCSPPHPPTLRQWARWGE